MEQLARIPDEVLHSKWREIAPLIDVLATRIGESEPFPVVTGSAFTGNDRGAAPYSVTYVANACLSSAIDHLHALKALVWDARLLHTSAPVTLARSAIENAVTGLWVISPASRNDRISRSLRWYAQDARDQHRGVLEREELPLGHDDNLVLRLTNSDQMALYFVLKALHSIEQLLQRSEFLAGLRTHDASVG